ncbi:hypothetical protein GQ54DRAFT_131722 [Martensiomyces pterosporus]|nr:hypothetical protein GQ54DRAFT_131722 [Martensiomyces pterosporus]
MAGGEVHTSFVSVSRCASSLLCAPASGNVSSTALHCDGKGTPLEMGAEAWQPKTGLVCCCLLACDARRSLFFVFGTEPPLLVALRRSPFPPVLLCGPPKHTAHQCH